MPDPAVSAAPFGPPRVLRMAAVSALPMFLAALFGFGALREGYGQGVNSIALLGTGGNAPAMAFNLLAYVLPGAVAAWVAWSLRSGQTRGGWRVRIGAQCLLLSALGFMSQGLLPLDLKEVNSMSNVGHAVAWTVWWLSFVLAGVLFVATPDLPRRVRIGSVVAGVSVLGLSVWPWDGDMVAVAQRLAVVLWLGWAGWVVSAAQVSTPQR